MNKSLYLQLTQIKTSAESPCAELCRLYALRESIVQALNHCMRSAIPLPNLLTRGVYDVWCSVVQCVAVWRNVVQCVAVCCSLTGHPASKTFHLVCPDVEIMCYLAEVSAARKVFGGVFVAPTTSCNYFALSCPFCTPECSSLVF